MAKIERFRRLASTFYDSQSGRYLTVPGSQGLRVHALPSLLPPFPSMVSSWQLIPSLPNATPRPGLALPTYVACSSASEVTKALVSGLGVVLSAPAGRASELLPLAGHYVFQTRSSQTRIPLRAVIQQCWQGKDDINTALGAVEKDLGLLADVGVDVITVADCQQKATIDSLREIIEAAFNLDVVGEAMMERLSVRVQSPTLLQSALRLKVTRCEAGPGALDLATISALASNRQS